MAEKEQAPVVIDVRDVKKKFRIYYDRGNTLKDRILFSARRRHEDRWVLKGISFQVRKGEAVGLIGENGCGKSTTLKMLTKILYPDAGSIEMKGRVSSLIELGAGFHPDLSGRENIYTNASIFGLSRKEIDERIEGIIAFSELGEFIDNPVRTYSSGMYMRLAFAVAINVDADILLIDEILAVGDAAFQAKCFSRMEEIKAKGTTIVIVSHALSQIEQVCERTIWIDQGVIRLEGSPRDVHPHYMSYMASKNAGGAAQEETPSGETGPDASESTEETDENGNLKRWGSGEARMQKVTVLDENGQEQRYFSPESPITVHVDYTAKQELTNAVIGLAVYGSDGTYVYGTNTLIDTAQPVCLKEKGTIDLKIRNLPVANGAYSIDLALHRPDGFNYDFWRDICRIHIADKAQTPGVIYLPHEWDVR